jgi:MFS family permease
MEAESDGHWRRNLVICLFGSFSTVFAMTLILPFLPIYVEQLGVHGHAEIVQWASIAYGANFLTAGLVAPLWGHLGDRFGRKPMLVRASLGMALTMPLMGLSSNIWQFVGLRLLAGVAGGYASGATILIAVQTPRHRLAWALGLLASGVMAGNLLGPLAGGSLPSLVGIRATFWVSGAMIFVAFLATAFFLREAPRKPEIISNTGRKGWSQIPNKGVVMIMLATGLLLMVANMSIEPIITVYVATLANGPIGGHTVSGGNSAHITTVAGFVLAAAALGSIVSASQLGRVADRVGHSTVIILALTAASLLLIPQAFVTNEWQLVVLRFLMGLALGGLLPCIAAVIRHNVPDDFVGTVMGYSLSAQFAGQVAGPLIGGFIGGQLGSRAVFLGTCLLLLIGAGCNWKATGFSRRN